MQVEVEDVHARLRDCLDRAKRARLAGDRRSYCRLIEEFLFLGKASTSRNGLLGDHMGRAVLARVLVVHEDEAVVQMMRECLIENAQAFHLERLPHAHVSGLLDTLDERRAHLLVIASSLRMAAGLGAMHEIRRHPRGRSLPVLVLSDDVGGADAMLALAAGATAYIPMPDNVSDYPRFADKMNELLEAEERRRQQA